MNTINPYDFLLIPVAYLIGSLSFAIFVSRIFYKTDIRDFGSHNPGANNIQRIFGWKAGLTVLIADFLKGVGAVSLVFLTELKPETEYFVAFQLFLGVAVVFGHIFPVFFNFKGGKGVATLCGVLCAMHPWAVLICAGVFLVVFFITRYVSLSVILAVTCYPFLINSIFAFWLQPDETLTLKVFSVVIALTIWLTHLSNIKRLIKGKEEKFSIKKPVSPVEEEELAEENLPEIFS